jgi:hypothetical protein
MDSLEEFPTEILRHIFLCFERDDWKNVLQVCKNWYSLGTRVFVEVLIYKGTRLLQMKNYKRSLKVRNSGVSKTNNSKVFRSSNASSGLGLNKRSFAGRLQGQGTYSL